MVKAHYEMMAEYDRWANTTLYSACQAVPDEIRCKVGVFFKSIHGTLNHLYLGDQMWMERFHGQPLSVTDIAAEIYSDFDELAAARQVMDERIIEWVKSIDDEWLVTDFSFWSAAYNRSASLPAHVLATHLFNHQTHHRGNLSTLIVQNGYEMPGLDLPWMLLP